MSRDNTTQDSIKDKDLIEYGIEDTPEFSKALPLGIQHLLAMFLSTVALPLVIASAIGLGNSDTTYIR